MGVKNFYYNLSIRYKILLFFYSIVIIIAVVLGCYSFSVTQKSVMQNLSSAYLGIINQVGNNLDVLKNDIIDISTYLCIDDTVQAYLTDTGGDLPDMALSRASSLNFIMNLVVSKSYISLISIYGDNSPKPYYVITDGSGGLNENFSDIKKTGIYKRALEAKGAPLWYTLDASSSFLQKNNYSRISMFRIIKDVNDMNPIGLLVVCMNRKDVESICSGNIQNPGEGITIVDSEGNIISQAGKDFFSGRSGNQAFIKASETSGQGSLADTINGEKYLVSYKNLDGFNWKIYYAVPMENLTKQVNSVKAYIIIVFLACVLLSFPLLLLVSSLLTAPVTKLLNSMKSFQKGNFDERVDIKYRDEVGELGDAYNNMVKNIKELIDRVYVLQIKEREAELDALQAQINPHFLYNTLDTIFWRCQSRGVKDIGEMVYSLSRLLRLSLNRGKDLTTVADERDMVEHYLLLQKIRFKENLNYEIYVDGAILGFFIPKLILQPFVENAILHGLEKKERGGSVKIFGDMSGGLMRFVIKDDGIGMSRQMLESILQESGDGASAPSGLPGGYAVKNVYDRLKLTYGSSFSLKFESTAGRGTSVEMLLPVLDGGREGKYAEYREGGCPE